MCQLIQHFLIFVLLGALKLYFFFRLLYFFLRLLCRFSFFLSVSCVYLLLSIILIISFGIILRNSYFIGFIDFIDKLVNSFLSAGSDAFTCRFILLILPVIFCWIFGLHSLIYYLRFLLYFSFCPLSGFCLLYFQESWSLFTFFFYPFEDPFYCSNFLFQIYISIV